MKRVTWTIDLDEDTAEAAAVVALAIMRDQESTATVFDITDETGKTVKVDLRRAGTLKPMLKCDGCGRRFAATEELDRVFPDIPDLVNRLDAGGIVPSGECPMCGALVYREQGRVRIGILLDGGLVKGVFADTASVDAAVLDTEVYETEDEEVLALTALGDIWAGVPQRQTPEVDRRFVGGLFDGLRRMEAQNRKEETV